MKHIYLFLFLICSLSTDAQPQSINYQGVARDAAGLALLNQNISLRLSILDSTSIGQALYVESHNATTNTTGLFSLGIGAGTVVSGVFANIPWAQGDKWLKIEMDATGGTNYQLIGTSQFLSAPYALYSSNVSNADNGVPTGGSHGQTLTFCDGMPEWTTNGVCPATICSQVWMAQNLDVSTYRNGDPIPKVTDPIQWAALTTGAWCWYNNDSATYAATYGKLYNWFAVNDSRGLAPVGWHVPTDAEWTTLETCLGGASVAGGKMKETGTSHWYSPNTAATNSSGFAGLPGGNRDNNGSFVSIGTSSGWWSSTANFIYSAWRWYLTYNSGGLGKYGNSKQNGFSVRCIRD